MNIVGKAAQTGAALWILNVWFLRFNKDTGYRGGDATNMVEEFGLKAKLIKVQHLLLNSLY